MGIDRATSGDFSDKYNSFVKKENKTPVSQPELSESTQVQDFSGFKFKAISAEEKKQVANLATKLADARGDDELSLKTNSEWASQGADFKLDPIAVKEPSMRDLTTQAVDAVNKLRSISDEAIENSETYKQLFNLNGESSDIEFDV